MYHRALCHLTAPLLALAALASGTAAASPLKLHVPSPDWRDQVIYFALTDRFDDGDPRNNDQGAGVFDPRRNDRYNGGDLAGLRRRLDYIQGLGATALWITPPNRNQWFDPWTDFTGYHGYWAQDFKTVDPHLGSLADYQRLSDALHRRGMYLVQDIVVNHVGNYFDYVGGWNPQNPAQHVRLNAASRPTAAPTQAPFDRNDPRRAADRRAGIYHWTPPLIDVKHPEHERTHQMSGLDDLNTENPRVRRALRDSFGHWIRHVGVDAFRVDTAFYVPPDFFEDFRFARDPQAPGIDTVARRTGRQDFLVFGEGFGLDAPGQSTQSARIESYMHGPQGQPRMGGMLNFPLYGSLLDVFARGRPTQELAARIDTLVRLHPRLHWMPSFVDNHDVDRWLNTGADASLRQALLAIMTLPGIPVVYYGTEQGYTEQRAALFAAGYGSGGRDRFDTQAPLYRLIARLSALRRAHREFSRGRPRLLAHDASGPGALAWRMDHAGQASLVVFNTAEHELLIDHLDTQDAAATRWEGVLGLDAGTPPPTLQADAQGRLTLRLPPRGAGVWRRVAAVRSDAPSDPSTATLTTPPPPQLDPLPPGPFTDDFPVRGRGPEDLRLVVDGDLARSRPLLPASKDSPDTTRQAWVDTVRMSDPDATHRAVLWSPSTGQASAAQSFRVARPWQLLADVADPEGDDHGPDGRYAYPTHSSFARGQMDLTRTRVWASGGSLRIELTLKDFSTVWNPAQGFDHVAFTVFLQWPERTGGPRALPGQNALLPDGMHWHLRLRAHGWSNALFDAEGADGQREGRPVVPAARIDADPAQRTVRFTLPAAALGDRRNFEGVKLYVTTWDYDGGFRALAPTPGPYVFGGGSPDAPHWLDASGVITLRTPPTTPP